jgi:hypothetical protein
VNLRVGSVGFIDDLLETVMGDDAQSINRLYTCSLAIAGSWPESATRLGTFSFSSLPNG